MVWIDIKNPAPIYEQIVNQYKNLIVRGVLLADTKMPSVRSLAMELSINPNTIQKAYAELERQGYIYTVTGRGAFVSAKDELKEEKTKEILEDLDRVVEETRAAGLPLEVLIQHIISRNNEL